MTGSRRSSSGRGRSPYGERGLKSHDVPRIRAGVRRSPYGERGLKCQGVSHFPAHVGRSPYGERGLKSVADPLRGAGPQVALLTESVD